ncbi:MAG: translation initiation factor IF-2 [Candidatus Uhrbacteria bacterium]
MNVTELARRCNLPPQELYEILPRYGFDVGRRAIKIDDRLADRFLKQWPRIRRELLRTKEKEREEEMRKARRSAVTEGTAQLVEIPAIVTVREFAAILQMPVSEVLQELLRNGILANLNEPIDYATAAIIAEDLGCKASPVQESDGVAEVVQEEDGSADRQARTGTVRPPVVVVMGHVDHGKTAILDSIRKTNVAGGEAGGITQHIGAYQVVHKNQPVTFIDTPGHEAFTTMRSRGARIADIAVLVVAGDDGVQPQTKEALKIIQAVKIPFVVAVNKIDRPEADAERVKQELGALGVTPEDWGGRVPVALVSAKAGTGITDLLELILLVAEVEQEKRVADADAPAETATIESHVDKQEGPVATLLVQNGTLRIGDTLADGEAIIGKVRAMCSYNGEAITEATPSMPARVLGLKILPEVGDIVVVPDGAKKLTKAKKRKATKQEPNQVRSHGQQVAREANADAIVLPVFVRADVLGSLEALCNEIERIGDADAHVKIVFRGLGNITESDLQQAEAAGAHVFGFGVRVPETLVESARESGVSITTHKVIYELLKSVHAALEAALPEETTREELGEMEVIALFKQSQHWQIIGGKVTKGRVIMDPNVQVVRDRDGAEGQLVALQAAKEEVREVVEGQECGVKVKGFEGTEAGDILKFIKIEVHKRKL